MDKLLPITSDGLLEPGEVLHVPITIEGLGDGNTTTIMMVPSSMNAEGDEDGVNAVMTFEAQQEQLTGTGHESSVTFHMESSNHLQQAMKMALAEQSRQESDGTTLGQQHHQDDVVISVASSDHQGIQQSISSIITSMAAGNSQSMTIPQHSTSTIDGSTTLTTSGATLIETQLSASEVASHFEDGTIIEITQIPTSGDGTALIPAGAVVERITPGMSASDIIMKAANMVASGQLAQFTSANQQFTVPMSIHRTGELVENDNHHHVVEVADSSGNTLPFLAHVATTHGSLPEVESAAIAISEEMDGRNGEASDARDSGGDMEQAVVEGSVEQGVMESNVEQNIVNVEQGMVESDMEHGMVEGDLEQGEGDMAHGIVDGSVEQGIVDGSVEHGIVEGSMEQDIVESNMEHGVPSNVEQGIIESEMEHGTIVKSDMEQSIVESNMEQGLVEQLVATMQLPDGSNVMQIIQTQAPKQ